jgi:hypothetical protein
LAHEVVAGRHHHMARAAVAHALEDLPHAHCHGSLPTGMTGVTLDDP